MHSLAQDSVSVIGVNGDGAVWARGKTVIYRRMQSICGPPGVSSGGMTLAKTREELRVSVVKKNHRKILDWKVPVQGLRNVDGDVYEASGERLVQRSGVKKETVMGRRPQKDPHGGSTDPLR